MRIYSTSSRTRLPDRLHTLIIHKKKVENLSFNSNENAHNKEFQMIFLSLNVNKKYSSLILFT